MVLLTIKKSALDPLVRVQALGWTRAAIESGFQQLSVAGDAEGEGALGRELLRQLRDAPAEIIDTLAFDLNAPSLEDTNLWKVLVRPNRAAGIADVLAQLRAQYTDPDLVAILRELLQEVAGGEVAWRDLDGDGQRILEALLVMGTSERFLLERYPLLSPDDFDDFDKIRALVHLHKEKFETVGGEVWRSLTWPRRASLIMWFADVELGIDSVVEALLDVDGTSLDLGDRTHYVEVLGVASQVNDKRLTLPIHDLLEKAFSSPQPLESEWVNFVRRAIVNLEERATDDERRRAESYGAG